MDRNSISQDFWRFHERYFSEDAEMTPDGFLDNRLSMMRNKSIELEYVHKALIQSSIKRTQELSTRLLLQPSAWGTYFAEKKPAASIYRGSNGYLFGFCGLEQGNLWS
jgi:hypothetical protein